MMKTAEAVEGIDVVPAERVITIPVERKRRAPEPDHRVSPHGSHV
jgi:hypothetical protein